MRVVIRALAGMVARVAAMTVSADVWKIARYFGAISHNVPGSKNRLRVLQDYDRSKRR